MAGIPDRARPVLVWGDAHALVRDALSFQPGMTLLVGAVLLGFAIMGLFRSVWS